MLIINMDDRKEELCNYNLSRFPQDETFKVIKAEHTVLFSLWNLWNYNDANFRIPGLSNLLRLESLQPMLDNTLEASGGDRKERRNSVFCMLFEYIFASDRENLKTEIKAFMRAHMDLFRQDIWKRKIFHQWLCDEGYVTAATYQKILDSVEPEDRDVVVAWGVEHKISERIDKARENMLKRPDLPLSEWRKRWHLEAVRNSADKKIVGYKLSDWHYQDNNLVVIPVKIGNIPVLRCNLGKLKCDTLVLEGDVVLDYDVNEVQMNTFDNRSSWYYSLDRKSAGYPEVAHIPEDKRTIAPSAFLHDNLLKKVEGLEHIEVIGYDAFADATNFREPLEIPKSVREVHSGAFLNCGIPSFRIHDTLVSCGRGAFASISGVKIFCSPETVGVIGGLSRVKEENT